MTIRLSPYEGIMNAQCRLCECWLESNRLNEIVQHPTRDTIKTWKPLSECNQNTIDRIDACPNSGKTYRYPVLEEIDAS